MQRILSFEQTPPLSIPLRFFLTAPLFAAAAGVALAWYGPQVFASRWSGPALAVTHWVTLGFLAMAMCGALLQILPVVAGIDLPKVNFTGSAVHALLTIGTSLLGLAFLTLDPWLFRLAPLLLVTALIWLLCACLAGALTSTSKAATLAAIRLALLALLVAVTLGAILAASFAWPLALPLVLLTHLHVSWALIGWVGLLIIGVAFQVVPMFQVTPVYPLAISRWLPCTVFFLLTAWSVLCATFVTRAAEIMGMLLAITFAIFGCITLYLLWKRKRPRPDPTTWFWRIGLASLLACTLLWLAAEFFPEIADAPSHPFLLGVLFMIGFAYSIINGMLYKIVPFLVWFHLQEKLDPAILKAPSVKQVITDSAAYRQLLGHVLALTAMLSAACWPAELSRLGGIAFAASSLWLWKNMADAVRLHWRYASMHKLSTSESICPG